MTLHSWVKRNPQTATLGAVALGLGVYFIWKRHREAHGYAVGGVWTDLANKQGIAIGSDLTIREAQRYLNGINNQTSPALGGKGLAEDGVAGPKTTAAIKKFQTGNGLPATGSVDNETGNALSYFAAATSKSGALKKYAAVSPETISSLSRPTLKTSKALASAVDIGGGWVMYGSCACHWDDADCAARCGGALPTMPPPSLGSDTATSGDFRTGIQSTSMFDVARSSYTDPFGHAIDGNVAGYGWE